MYTKDVKQILVTIVFVKLIEGRMKLGTQVLMGGGGDKPTHKSLPTFSASRYLDEKLFLSLKLT